MTNRFRIAGVPEHFNLPWNLALADDAFANTGLQVEFYDYPGGTGAMTQALRDHELEAALVLTEGAVLDILKGSDNRLVSVFVDSPLVWGIHVAGSGDIRTVDSIGGRRVAISRYGSGSHLIAVVDAIERGFPVDDMQFEVVDNLDGARDALATGRADVFLWERHMTQPLVDSGEFRRVGERKVPWPAFVVSVRQDVLDQSASSVRSILEIVRDYASRLQEGESSATLISTSYGIALADAKRFLKGVRWSRDFDRPAEALEKVVDALVTQGAIDSASSDTLWYSLLSIR